MIGQKHSILLWNGRAAVLLACLALTACAEQAPPPSKPGPGTGRLLAELEISNPSQFFRGDEPVSMSLNALGLTQAELAGTALQVVIAGQPGPVQLVDEDGDGSPENAVFLLDLEPAATVSAQILTGVAVPGVKRVQAEISRKEGGYWQDGKYIGGEFGRVTELVQPPQSSDHAEYIRYEGPGIESDRVGYRFYLDWRNGFDIFGKKTDRPVLQDVGLDGYNSYHEMADWGMDILKVGDSLGMGGYGYWDGKTVKRVSTTRSLSARVLADGDVLAALAIEYAGWSDAGAEVDLDARLSMIAGSRLVRTRLNLSRDLPNLAIGLVRHEQAELIQGSLDVPGASWTYLASFGPQSLDGQDLGMFLLFRKADVKKITHDEHNQVVVMKVPGRQLEYYFGAAWAGESGGITSREEFEAYLQREAERLTLQPRLRMKTAKTAVAMAGELTAGKALGWARRVADSEIQRRGSSLAHGGFDALRGRPSDWNYTTGLLMLALDDLAGATGEEGYADYAQQTISSFIDEDGDIRGYRLSDYNIDKVNSGKMLLRLFRRTGEARFQEAAALLARQLETHPRTSDGAFWHKQRYPWQLWLDGVYMGMPFLAEYGAQHAKSGVVDEAVAEVLLTRRHLRDGQTGLYYHGWDERRAQSWADPQTGLSANFWSRGLGWYAMALVDILDVIPAGREDLREPVLEIVRELAPVLAHYQAADGAWFQVTDQPGRAGNYREASGSAMFTYFLAKAVNRGYLGGEYRELALNAYRGLLDEFVLLNADGSVSVTGICEVAGLGYGRDGSYRYYLSEPVVHNDPKGLGPFVLASIQVAELLKPVTTTVQLNQES